MGALRVNNIRNREKSTKKKSNKMRKIVQLFYANNCRLVCLVPLERFQLNFRFAIFFFDDLVLKRATTKCWKLVFLRSERISFHWSSWRQNSTESQSCAHWIRTICFYLFDIMECAATNKTSFFATFFSFHFRSRQNNSFLGLNQFVLSMTNKV